MNIFKILSSGDGKLHEPNISAFLGYLLDPNSDHGLKGALLDKILQEFSQRWPDHFKFCAGQDGVLPLPHPDLDVVVLLEQAFKTRVQDADSGEPSVESQPEPTKKSIIDIAILFFSKTRPKRESAASALIAGGVDRSLSHVMLIEVKIRDGSTTPGQLEGHIRNTIDCVAQELNKSPEEVANLVSLAFISTHGTSAQEEFNRLRDSGTIKNRNTPCLHFSWGTADPDATSHLCIHRMLREILARESEGLIDSIGDYQKHTLKAFLAFIASDFSSYVADRVAGNGRSTKQYASLDELSASNTYEEDSLQISRELESLVAGLSLEHDNKLIIRHFATQPVVLYLGGGSGTRIFRLQNQGKILTAWLECRNFISDTDSYELNGLPLGKPDGNSNIQIRSRDPGEIVACIRQHLDSIKANGYRKRSSKPALLP